MLVYIYVNAIDLTREKLVTQNDFEHQVIAFNCQSEALNYNESAAVLGALTLFDHSALLQDPRVV